MFLTYSNNYLNEKLQFFDNLLPLTPMCDQDRISPYNINKISSRQVMRLKKKYQSGDYELIP